MNTPKTKAPPRQHITTTLPIDLIAELDAYVADERVKRSAVYENALRKFFAAEKVRKGKE